MRKRMAIFERSRHKAAVIAVSLLAVFIVAISNLIVSELSQLGKLSADFTDNRYFSITPETVAYLTSLPEILTVTVLGDEAGLDTYVKKVLERIDAATDRVTVRYLDPLLNPAEVEKYKVDGSIAKGTIVVSSNTRFEMFLVSDCYVADAKGHLIGFNAEGKIVTTIVKVIGQEQDTVLFTEGHGENSASELRRIFADNGMQVGSINLNQEDIPAEADLLVMVGPERDADAAEIRRIDDFTHAGGKVMIFKDSRSRENDRLSQFLLQWGLRLRNDVIIDNDYYYMNNPLYLIATPTERPFLRNIAEGDKLLIFPITQVVENLFADRADGAYRTESLSTSSGRSYAKAKSADMSYDFVAGDRMGPFDLAVLSRNAGSPDSRGVDAAVFLCGSVLAVDDTLLTIQNFANAEMMITTANDMLGNKDRFVVPVKYFDAGYLNLRAESAKTLGNVFTYGFPGIVLLAGIIVWIRRRNR
jgi:ABC-2 type transport system permease protein